MVISLLMEVVEVEGLIMEGKYWNLLVSLFHNVNLFFLHSLLVFG